MSISSFLKKIFLATEDEENEESVKQAEQPVEQDNSNQPKHQPKAESVPEQQREPEAPVAQEAVKEEPQVVVKQAEPAELEEPAVNEGGKEPDAPQKPESNEAVDGNKEPGQVVEPQKQTEQKAPEAQVVEIKPDALQKPEANEAVDEPKKPESIDEPAESEEIEQAQPKFNIPDNAIDIKNKAITAIRKSLEPLYGTKTKFVASEVLVYDTRAYMALNNEEFDNELKLEFAHASIQSLVESPMSLRQGKDGSSNVIAVLPWLGLRLVTNEEEVVATSVARITLYPSSDGSLMKPSYTLDSNLKLVFNIGRCDTNPPAGAQANNDIAIDGTTTDNAKLQTNRTVSSQHAQVLYRNESFYLKAKPGGCRAQGGSVTKIVRKGVENELYDTIAMHRLKDGDIIRVGSKVLLLFELV